MTIHRVMDVMNWLRKSFSQQLLGYRVVGFRPEERIAYSLYNPNITYALEIGSVEKSPTPQGLYLGTSKNFALDYYSGLTDDPELLLTYSFDMEDVLDGDPNSPTPGEIRVQQMILVSIEPIQNT